jgi:prevent-host-death family protein
MHTMGVTELKASLSEQLARVKAGEVVLVTEHGRPIAKIVPLSLAAPEAADPGDGADDELVRSGVLLAPERPLDDSFWTLPCPKDPTGRVLAALLDERRSGW